MKKQIKAITHSPIESHSNLTSLKGVIGNDFNPKGELYNVHFYNSVIKIFGEYCWKSFH